MLTTKMDFMMLNLWGEFDEVQTYQIRR